MGLLDRFIAPTEEVKFISQTLADYREVRKVYHYEYQPEDLKALQACAKDLRPFTWSAVPAGICWWLSGRYIPTKGRALPFRVMVAVGRLMATGQVFRAGYLAGSFRQTTTCMRGLVSLPTPLGGEMVALIKARNPDSPYLKYERLPPGLELSSDSRPRIATETNRQAQIAKFQKELATARAGKVVHKADGEVLEGLMQQHQRTLDDIVNAEEHLHERQRQRQEARAAAGAAGASSTGRPALPPIPSRGSAPSTTTSSSSSSSREAGVTQGPHGLVITDEPPSEQPAVPRDREQAAATVRDILRLGSSDSQGTAAAQQGQEGGAAEGGDVFGELLGGGGGGLWVDEAAEAEEQKRLEQQARRERRRDRWGRVRRTKQGEQPGAGDKAPMEGSD